MESNITFKNFLNGFISWSKAPVYYHERERINQLKLFCYAFLVMLLINVIQILVQFPVLESLPVDNQLEYFISDNDDWIVIFLIICIFTPIMEETLFRLYLRKVHIFTYVLTLLVAIFFVFNFLAYGFMLQDFSQLPVVIANYIGVIISIFIPIKMLITYKNNDFFEIIYQTLYKRLVWLSALGFGMMHASNFYTGIVDYEITKWQLVIFTYFILTYTLGRAAWGMLMSYVRVKYNFFMVVVLHFINNFISTIILYVELMYIE